MKRALFCLLAAWRMAFAFIGVRAENVTMMTDVFGNERFSVVEEAARRFLRYERKQGNERPMAHRMVYAGDGSAGERLWFAR